MLLVCVALHILCHFRVADKNSIAYKLVQIAELSGALPQFLPRLSSLLDNTRPLGLCSMGKAYCTLSVCGPRLDYDLQNSPSKKKVSHPCPRENISHHRKTVSKYQTMILKDHSVSTLSSCLTDAYDFNTYTLKVMSYQMPNLTHLWTNKFLLGDYLVFSEFHQRIPYFFTQIFPNEFQHSQVYIPPSSHYLSSHIAKSVQT